MRPVQRSFYPALALSGTPSVRHSFCPAHALSGAPLVHPLPCPTLLLSIPCPVQHSSGPALLLSSSPLSSPCPVRHSFHPALPLTATPSVQPTPSPGLTLSGVPSSVKYFAIFSFFHFLIFLLAQPTASNPARTVSARWPPCDGQRAANR